MHAVYKEPNMTEYRKKIKGMGWWTNGHNGQIKELNKIGTALRQISKPVYIVDINGKICCSTEGSAMIGADGTTPPMEFTNGHSLYAYVPALPLENLGNYEFKKRHNLKYPYIAGAMANGIASVEMVKAMAKNGMMGFFGAGGLGLDDVESAIIRLKTDLPTLPFGFNLIHSPSSPGLEMSFVELYLKHGIKLVSAAAFMSMTLPLVYYRLKGIHVDSSGEIKTPNKIIAKVSRIELAKKFFSPAPAKIVSALVEKNLISIKEAELSQYVPIAQDLTAEADSGGHTDNRPALALLPTMISLKNQLNEKYNYKKQLCVGLAGGIATPESAAAGFNMGADYILTGSINQSCIESGTSNHVKKLLAQAEQADVAMAPAADMFEIGARVQVLKRGTLFPVKAEKLYRAYNSVSSFENIQERTKKEIEEKILKADFEDKWQEIKEFFRKRDIKEIQRAENDTKHKMALIFRSYLGLSSKWPLKDIKDRRMDFQIWCGPAMGAFNQWVKGSFLERVENRKVAEIGLNLLIGASICTRISWLKNQGINLPWKETGYYPIEQIYMQEFLSV